MWSGKRHEHVHLVAVLMQQRERSADYQPADGVCHEAQAPEGRAWAPITNVIHHFLRQTNAHLIHVAFGVVLIGVGTQEDGIWIEQCNVVLHESHVKGVALETMMKNEEMDTSVAFGSRRDALALHTGWGLGVSLFEEDWPKVIRRDERGIFQSQCSWKELPALSPSCLRQGIVFLPQRLLAMRCEFHLRLILQDRRTPLVNDVAFPEATQ
mmetsp:Transcript_44972/g.104042  ORF Transcript_44972/g.104042 Transcript_44972/m.104042 type:complete len:211 (-) Transcript_44972:1244-1876(-)